MEELPLIAADGQRPQLAVPNPGEAILAATAQPQPAKEEPASHVIDISNVA